MQDRDTINQENEIDYRIRLEEREIKNKILAMPEYKKQREWTKAFGLMTGQDDSYLLGKVF